MSMNTRTKRLFTAYCHEYSIIHEVPWPTQHSLVSLHGRGSNGDFVLHVRTWFLRPYLDSRLRETTCSHENHASSLVLLCYMRSNTLRTTIMHRMHMMH